MSFTRHLAVPSLTRELTLGFSTHSASEEVSSLFKHELLLLESSHPDRKIPGCSTRPSLRRKKVNPSAAFPPSPILVGVELNPGPSVMNVAIRKRKSKKPRRRTTTVDRTFFPNGGYPYMSVHSSNSQSITITAMGASTLFTSSTTVPIFASRSIQLNDFPAGSGSIVANMLTCFDQYRIDEVEAWLFSDAGNEVNQAPGGVGNLVSAVDLDDVSTPTTLQALMSYGSSLVSGGGAAHYHRWKPHVAIAAYSGAFSSFANQPSPWIDSASPGVQHYGLKAGISTTLGTIPYNLIVRAKITFRSTF